MHIYTPVMMVTVFIHVNFHN